MKKILVPTDFSACADKALSYALNISKKAGAEIILLHVCDLFDIRTSKNKDLLMEHNRLVTSDLNRKLDRYKKTAVSESIKLTTMLYSGQVVQTILAVAGEAAVDLIVMGSQGSTCLKSSLMGMNATKVLARTNVPVITVPSAYQWTDPKKILVAANEAETESHLAPVTELGKLLDAEVITVAISSERDESAEIFESVSPLKETSSGAFKSAGAKGLHLTGNNFDSVMNDFISKENIDLLVMFHHERNIIDKIFNANKTKKLEYHGAIPMMSIRI